MIVRSVSRARDVEVLGWLACRVRGESFAAIGRLAGKQPILVSQACRAVRDADIAEAGEPVPAEDYP